MALAASFGACASVISATGAAADPSLLAAPDWPARLWPILLGGLLLGMMALVGLLALGQRSGLAPALAAPGLQQVLRGAPFPAMLRDETGRILEVNAAWETMSGYARGDLTDVEAWMRRALGGPDAEPLALVARLHRLGEAVDEGERAIRAAGGASRVWAISSMPAGLGPGGARLAVTMAADLTDRKETESRLRATLAERDLLLREVYHRVKNNLQVIDSLVGLQAARVEDPTARSQMRDLRHRVHALGLVHQQLMQSKDLATFDLAPFLGKLCDNLAVGWGAATRGIRIEVTSEPMQADLDFAAPLSLLVTELVTNALKHAFAPEEAQGLIRVSLLADPEAAGALRLTVADNGAVAGRQGPAPEGLGAQITRALVGQLRGKLSVAVADGTCVSVDLPLPEAA